MEAASTLLISMTVVAVMAGRGRVVARTRSDRTDYTVTMVSSSAGGGCCCGGSRVSTMIDTGLG